MSGGNPLDWAEMLDFKTKLGKVSPADQFNQSGVCDAELGQTGFHGQISLLLPD